MGSTKLKIAYFHQDGLITGSAISLRNMIQSLDRSIYEPIVVLAKEGKAKELLEQIDVIVYIFEFDTFWTSPGPNCFSRENILQYNSFISSKKLRSFIEKLKPNLIHINDKAALQVGISMKGRGIPIIQHSRSAYHNTNCKFNKYLSSHCIKSYANHIIAISEDEVQGFETFSGLSILYNTVNLSEAELAIQNRETLRKTLGIQKEEIVIGMAENMSVRKGLLDIVSIIKYVKDNTISNVKFLMVGKLNDNDSLKSVGEDKSSYDYFMNFILSENLQEKILLVGHQTKVLQYIAAMDIIIISKSHGVLGRQPIEAQAVGTTVLAINGHSKKSTLVQQGEGGFLVNTLEELKPVLSKLLSDPGQLSQHGNKGRVYAKEHFDMNTYKEKLSKIYKQYLAH